MNWIDVKDRLPEHGILTSSYVLTINSYGHIDCLDFIYKNWYKDNIPEETYITHWMPLPEPPNKQK
jgi:hypothetical protein